MCVKCLACKCKVYSGIIFILYFLNWGTKTTHFFRAEQELGFKEERSHICSDFFTFLSTQPLRKNVKAFYTIIFKFCSIGFIFFFNIAFVTIKIVSKHFTENQGLTPNKQQWQETIPFNRKKLWAGPGSWPGWMAREGCNGKRIDKGENKHTSHMQQH